MDDVPNGGRGPLHSVESQLCFALYSVTNAVGRTYAPLLEVLGLTYSQYLAMLVLWERDDIGVGDIGRRLFLDSGTLTPLLKRLEAAGLVERRRNQTDERQVRIWLTPRGTALRDKARSLPEAMACAMGRSGTEITTLRDDLLRLRSSLMAALDGHHRDDADPAS
ncbi:MarR family transcriptional regulator [Lichenihabitans sp. Uapishka_5]|uniref:MarR family winged helix-turn-helix transcriptional regulator n=1 Tax=Lichenihabitans sp. Uapishka_5 TaxID=3037302 RepID=UPI0029E7D623|nr:MarR family transcriptional regulator [Lichenihabitans sp. Uapishka_5]MDX7952728.1 MarR family transcriptional regulator [Lichenihabitans sp. Uapishka_5]